jgi:hypothetical protein
MVQNLVIIEHVGIHPVDLNTYESKTVFLLVASLTLSNKYLSQILVTSCVLNTNIVSSGIL